MSTIVVLFRRPENNQSLEEITSELTQDEEISLAAILIIKAVIDVVTEYGVEYAFSKFSTKRGYFIPEADELHTVEVQIEIAKSDLKKEAEDLLSSTEEAIQICIGQYNMSWIPKVALQLVEAV